MTKATGKNVIIKLVREVSTSGIIIPDAVKVDEKAVAYIEDLGPLCELGLQVGQKPIWRGSAPMVALPSEDEHIKFFVISEDHIIAVED